MALLAPRGTPKAAIERINDAVGKALADKEIRERFALFAFEPHSFSPAEIARQIEADSRRYGEVVKRARIALD